MDARPNHDHDAMSATAVAGRWVVKCRCGNASIGLTLDSAARTHRGHADVARLLVADGRA